MARRPPRRVLTPEERALWRRIARQVKPLDENRLKRLEAAPDPEPTSSRAAPPQPASPRKTGAALRDPASPNSTPGARAPVDRSGEKRVRRGRVEVEARLDLHGMTASSARTALLRFLKRAREDGKRQVLVITGKGAGKRALDRRRLQPWDPGAAPPPGVLRRSFAAWMADPDFAQLASGYAEAHRRHGGSGAFYVMLRQG